MKLNLNKMEIKTKEGKQITVRIKPFISFGDPRYKVEIKRWWDGKQYMMQDLLTMQSNI